MDCFLGLYDDFLDLEDRACEIGRVIGDLGDNDGVWPYLKFSSSRTQLVESVVSCHLESFDVEDIPAWKGTFNVDSMQMVKLGDHAMSRLNYLDSGVEIKYKVRHNPRKGGV